MKPRQLYHFHVHKTGGVWFLSNVIAELGEYTRPHLDHTLSDGFLANTNLVTPIDLYKDDYIMSSFRDPVKRTISHFAWTMLDVDIFYKDPFNKDLGIYTDVTVENLMEWIEIRKSFISNYQSKMFLYPLVHDRYGMGYSDFLFSEFTPEKEAMYEQLKKVDFFYRTEQGIEKNKEDLKTIIWDEFAIPMEKRISVKSEIAQDHSNKVSADLYSSLSTKQKEYIASINDIDSEIYETNSLFWKNGIA